MEDVGGVELEEDRNVAGCENAAGYGLVVVDIKRGLSSSRGL